MPLRCRAPLLACLLTLFLLPFGASAQASTGVGFQAIAFHDPVSGGEMPGYVFYPSAHPSQTTWRGPYELQATADAPPIAGGKPLVVISHGHAGSSLGHHDLAEYLAGHGFVVATLEHPGDNFHDASGAGTAAVLDGRPAQVKAAIHDLLDDPRWKTLIDPRRIGVAGFSAGGYTALAVVGAVPRFDLYVGFCDRRPEDPDCTLLQKLRSAGTATAALAALQTGFGAWDKPDAPDVKAAFVMAPLALVFDEAGVADVKRPVFLYYAEEDEVLPPQENARHLAPLMATITRVETVPRAGHYVFLAPCSPQLAKEAPELCEDPPGVDRAAVHRRINADALSFFRERLDVHAH